MDPAGRVLIIDGIVPALGGDAAPALFDLNMLVATGGRDRTLDEWSMVGASAGFRLVEAHPTRTRFHVLEFERA